jgi:hypothetical protein
MPVGNSGRIVIEMDPELKQELYRSLANDKLSLKEWFLENVDLYLSDKTQLPLEFSENKNKEASA